ncbi:AEC family transporter [Guyparkeria hydrothermalis]|uniref:AEC family transporter n=1 Tax=Guyparkeria hydrothermalis TaxID=923 RepID=UPI0020211CE0|nr:AEC family transporter [Guyparkeria hydrothermalis]
MISVILQMAGTIALGHVWRYLPLGGWTADRARGALTSSVYYLFLPALVFSVLWRAPLGVDTLRIAGTAAVAVLTSMALMALVGRMMRLGRLQFGALLLAASFPNATYMGLPLLGSLFGDAGKAIAIQYDLFACTPLLLSVGILLAARFGESEEAVHPIKTLLKVPPLWAAVAGAGLNLAGVPQPDWAAEWLDRIGAAVVPVMLVALGMSLRLETLTGRQLLTVSPAIAIQLLWMPLAALGFALAVGAEGLTLTAVVLEAAMPVMVLGLVICDRFGLDTSLYATTASASTLLALLSLPFWHGLAS